MWLVQLVTLSNVQIQSTELVTLVQFVRQ